jgi:glycosyltransferase involved in cell wall biosynthesis
MNVCFDYSAALQQGAGIGRYGREMLPRLRDALAPDTASVFTNNAARLAWPAPLQPYQRFSVPWSNKTWRLRVALDYLLGRDRDALLPGVDLFFAADHLLPRFRAIKSIINIRDLSFVLFPQYHTRGSRVFQRLLMPRFARHATHIVVPSRSTQRDVVAQYAVPAERITVIPEGVDDRFRQPLLPDDQERIRHTYSLPHPFVLYVGTWEPRKNVEGLVRAFADVVRSFDGAPLDLVLAGKLGWLHEPITQQIAASGLGDRVRRIGYVAEGDLPALYAAATVFAFPSWYEGFGLPPLEAMACGTPVVASNAGSLAEVVGDAGLLVDPAAPHELAAALRAVVEQPDLRLRLSHAGRQRAAAYTWERTARGTAALCRKLSTD